jgi:hypothetical protein
VFYDLIVWNKTLIQVNPINYLSLALSICLLLVSGLGMRKTQAVCYVGSAVSLMWFLYWILYDVLVWGKPLEQVRSVNYGGTLLSLSLAFIPTIISSLPKKRAMAEASQKQFPKQTTKRATARKF